MRVTIGYEIFEGGYNTQLIGHNQEKTPCWRDPFHILCANPKLENGARSLSKYIYEFIDLKCYALQETMDQIYVQKSF